MGRVLVSKFMQCSRPMHNVRQVVNERDHLGSTKAGTAVPAHGVSTAARTASRIASKHSHVPRPSHYGFSASEYDGSQQITKHPFAPASATSTCSQRQHEAHSGYIVLSSHCVHSLARASVVFAGYINRAQQSPSVLAKELTGYISFNSLPATAHSPESPESPESAPMPS